MAKFKQQNLRFKDNQKAQFGDNQDANIWWDGSDLRLDTTISGVTPTQDYHLTTKAYVDTEVAAVSGTMTFTGLTDTPSNYSSAENNRAIDTLKLLAVNSGASAVEFATAVSSILDGGASDVEYTGTVLFGIWIPHNPLDGGVSNSDYDGLAAMDGGSASSF